MTLKQLIAADIATQRQYALVFGKAIADTLADRWSKFGTTNCVPIPLLLADGDYFLSADILSEIGQGGLLAQMWNNSNFETIETATRIVPWAEAIALPRQGI